MLMTLGGLGLWTIIDFFRILFGIIKDADGQYVKQWCQSNTAPKLIASFALMILSLSGSIATASKMKFNKKFFVRETSIAIKKDTSHEIIKFVDSEGITHFVNDPDKIPEEYRPKAETNLKLPEINRIAD